LVPFLFSPPASFPNSTTQKLSFVFSFLMIYKKKKVTTTDSAKLGVTVVVAILSTALSKKIHSCGYFSQSEFPSALF
jgi:hypothetical protein